MLRGKSWGSILANLGDEVNFLTYYIKCHCKCNRTIMTLNTTPVNMNKSAWHDRRGFMLGRGEAIASPAPPKPEHCPNVLVTTAVCSIKTYYTAFFGLQNTPKCVSDRDSWGSLRRSLRLPSRTRSGIPLPIPHPTRRFLRIDSRASISEETLLPIFSSRTALAALKR